MAGMFGQSSMVRGRFREASSTWGPMRVGRKLGGRFVSSQLRSVASRPSHSSLATMPPSVGVAPSALPRWIVSDDRILKTRAQNSDYRTSLLSAPILSEMAIRFLMTDAAMRTARDASMIMRMQRIGRKLGGRFLSSQVRQPSPRSTSSVMASLLTASALFPEEIRRMVITQDRMTIREALSCFFNPIPAPVAGSLPEELRRLMIGAEHHMMRASVSGLWARYPVTDAVAGGLLGRFLSSVDSITRRRALSFVVVARPLKGRQGAFIKSVEFQRRRRLESSTVIGLSGIPDAVLLPTELRRLVTGTGRVTAPIPMSQLWTPHTPEQALVSLPIELRRYVAGTGRVITPIPMSQLWTPQVSEQALVGLPIELRRYVLSAEAIVQRPAASLIVPVRREESRHASFLIHSPGRSTSPRESSRIEAPVILIMPNGPLPEELRRFVVGAERQFIAGLMCLSPGGGRLILRPWGNLFTIS